MRRWARVLFPSQPSWRWAAWAVLGALGASAVATMGVRALSVRRAVAETRKLVAAERFAEAQGPLARWLQAQPRSPEAHLFKARVALGLNRLPEMTAELQQAGQLGGARRPIERVRALADVRAGRYAQAEPILRELLSSDMNPDPDVAEALARIYLETYRLDDAAAVIDRWIRDAPGQARAYLWRTEVDKRLDVDPAVTIADFEASLRLDPNLDRARLGLANALCEAHRARDAAGHFAIYLGRQPADPEGHLGAGRAALEQGDAAGAERHFERALALEKSHTGALRELARLQLAQGRFRAALDLLDRLAPQGAFDTEFWNCRSQALAGLGRLDEARSAKQRVARLRQDAQHVLDLRRRLNADPQNTQLQAQIARWLVEHGKADEGVRWARVILAQQPDHPAANQLMVDYYTNQGNPGLANYYRSQITPSTPAAVLNR